MSYTIQKQGGVLQSHVFGGNVCGWKVLKYAHIFALRGYIIQKQDSIFLWYVLWYVLLILLLLLEGSVLVWAREVLKIQEEW